MSTETKPATTIEPPSTTTTSPPQPTTNTSTTTTTTDPIADLESQLPTLITQASHSEIWGIPLTSPSPQRTLVLKKYLQAHKTVPAASAALAATLAWRKTFDPESCITGPEATDPLFAGLGYVTSVDPARCAGGGGTSSGSGNGSGGNGGSGDGGNSSSSIVRSGGGGRRAVVTWNVYGAVSDHRATFGDAERFVRWRVGLMERGVRALRLADPELPPPRDDVAMVQVHDYLGVSFLRLPGETRAATKRTIEVLSAHYPELLSRKYFVNVPVVMGWMFAATKAFLSKETVAKFQVLSYGSYMAAELGDEVPKVYGGQGSSLEEQDLASKETKGKETAREDAVVPATTTGTA